MVGPEAVWRLKSVSFKALKLLSFLHLPCFAFEAGVKLAKLSIDYDLGFNSKQDGVVHDVLRGQEVCVLLDDIVDAGNVVLRHLNLLDMVLVLDKVLILQSRCVLGEPLNHSAECASLQVVDARNVR